MYSLGILRLAAAHFRNGAAELREPRWRAGGPPCFAEWALCKSAAVKRGSFCS